MQSHSQNDSSENLDTKNELHLLDAYYSESSLPKHFPESKNPPITVIEEIYDSSEVSSLDDKIVTAFREYICEKEEINT